MHIIDEFLDGAFLLMGNRDDGEFKALVRIPLSKQRPGYYRGEAKAMDKGRFTGAAIVSATGEPLITGITVGIDPAWYMGEVWLAYAGTGKIPDWPPMPEIVMDHDMVETDQLVTISQAFVLRP